VENARTTGIPSNLIRSRQTSIKTSNVKNELLTRNIFQQESAKTLDRATVWPTAAERLVLLRERVVAGAALGGGAEGGVGGDGDGLDGHSWLADGAYHVPGLIGVHLLVQLLYIVVDDDIGIDHQEPHNDVDCDCDTFVDFVFVTADGPGGFIRCPVQTLNVVCLGVWLVEDGPEGEGSRDDTREDEDQETPAVGIDGIARLDQTPDEPEY